MPMNSYEIKKANLKKLLKKNPDCALGLKKKTASNLFRYVQSVQKKKRKLDVRNFDDIIAIDLDHLTLDVEGCTPYEKIVRYTLQHGFLPEVAPELKHITIGGAIVGIGIESTGHKFGFVHDGVLEAEVLLPTGEIVCCTPENEYADLFHALPNSYGTLGYVLRAKIKLYRAAPRVRLVVHPFSNVAAFIQAMERATQDLNIQFIDGLVFSKTECYLLTGYFENNADKKIEDIYRSIFYKLIQTKKEIYLSTEDYIFRYDPDWFWNLPETKSYDYFRRFSPKFLRNSGFYQKYIFWKNKVRRIFGINAAITATEETLIQDWEVIWEQGIHLLDFALNNINLQGKPWAVVPIRPKRDVTLYPVEANILYFNLGCYSPSQRNTTDAFHSTKLMDTYCYSLKGLKMLYSTTFMSQEAFYKIYNGEQYAVLKNKYDPKHFSGMLYDKVCLS